ncbi:HEAT repeat domain-containing protein [Myxosarcina sp. GI1]|uniref:HEAT repeat domain-containing protein n=1 Tax=Myxosarcina sp. GI1 TaxID=1541065 RepID=UPI0005643165|nr:HEAT repeat domain-containing protein [Myxosarcina sp. GI1]
MDNTSDIARNSSNSPQLSPEETDRLLVKVKQQLAEDTFDTSDRALITQMVESMGDKRGLVRLNFAESLGKVGKPAVPSLLDALANHQNVVVRRAAAKTLTLISDPTAVPHLVRALLTDEDPVVKGSTVGALAQTGEVSATPLLKVLSSPDSPESTKGLAAWGLAFIGSKAKDKLYEAYNSDSPEVRAAVVGAIAKVAEENREPHALELLVNSLDDSAANVRSEAAAALGNLAYPPAVPHLIELLNYPDGETRKSAALSLMKLKNLDALEPLKNARERETEDGVKRAISLAITQLERATENDWE